MQKKLAEKAQLGGHKKHSYDEDDDIFEDDDSEMYFPKMKRSTILSDPISFWWYDPYVFRIKKYYVPTYVAPLAPYVTIPLYLP